MAWW
jgi:hypothetical protein